MTKLRTIAALSLALMAFSDDGQKHGPYIALPGNGTVPRMTLESREHWCSRMVAFLWVRGVDQAVKEAILEKMRNRGCLQ